MNDITVYRGKVYDILYYEYNNKRYFISTITGDLIETAVTKQNMTRITNIEKIGRYNHIKFVKNYVDNIDK